MSPATPVGRTMCLGHRSEPGLDSDVGSTWRTPAPACQAGATLCLPGLHPPPPLCSPPRAPPTSSVTPSTWLRPQGLCVPLWRWGVAALLNQRLFPFPRAGPMGKETDAQAGAGQSGGQPFSWFLQHPPHQPRVGLTQKLHSEPSTCQPMMG